MTNIEELREAYERMLASHGDEWRSIHLSTVEPYIAALTAKVKEAQHDEVIIATLRDMEADAVERAEQAEAEVERLKRFTPPSLADLIAVEPAGRDLMLDLHEFGPERASQTELVRIVKRLTTTVEQAEAEVERITELADTLHDSLNEAEARAARWEWVARHTMQYGGLQGPKGMVTGRTHETVRKLLARYDAEHGAGK